MKSYGMDFRNSSVTNIKAEELSDFPANPVKGRLFTLNTQIGNNAPGLYCYDGDKWVTGDITKVTASTGLIGGGESGDIQLSIDTSIVATKEDLTEAINNIPLPSMDGGFF